MYLGYYCYNEEDYRPDKLINDVEFLEKLLRAVNQNFYQLRTPNPNSGLGCLVFLILVGLIFGPAGLGWIVNGILLFLAAAIIIPLIGILALQWYFRNNQIMGSCPVCGYGFMAMKNTNVTCGQCGENLSVGQELFSRYTPEGTIEVDAVSVVDGDPGAIEVEVRPLEEGKDHD